MVAEIELFRLEQRYTRQRGFASEAQCAADEYIYSYQRRDGLVKSTAKMKSSPTEMIVAGEKKTRRSAGVS